MAKHSFRHPTTQVLKASGYMDANEPGDLMQDESDDFALAPGLWYWDGAAWEAYAPAARPNGVAFLLAIRAAMTVSSANTLVGQYPLALQAIQLGVWADLEALVIMAHDATHIDDALYNVIRDAAATYAIPINLPALP